ncbi:MAG: alpha-L-rhamnosidase C-terminal domain-containing protein [Massilibacteroides sp.]|nr:alpha-L-rhamnosidase C-terminal domain-containing protein [Massilibacteroides sp.]MDD3061526.1 alpha-L-rhamnosidase C-terminal domain-containing protein [Massilibacteroides sp.]MDD4114930.1 alpha-L-rhamnosidase C-terminal domain-containing protein [Massilibacteroides sp.]MDD4659184.1 alpha-L-rhamnosidase C-terminal domain-containing protein [Massilibacteroides sp.]
MNKFVFFTLLFFVFSFLICAAEKKPTSLMTDLIEHTEQVFENGYRSSLSLTKIHETVNPVQYVEIISAKPSFSWVVPALGEKTEQTAYQIVLYQKKCSVQGEGDLFWESGVVGSNRSVGIIYDGKPLNPDEIYAWKVKVKTNNGESDWSDLKTFKTAKWLSDYKATAYPVVKTVDSVVLFKQVTDTVRFFDFSKAAFGQLLLMVTTDRPNDSLRVHLGERVRDGRVDRSPGGTIRYQCHVLPLAKGTHTYRILIPKDKRNTGSAAILMPSYIGEVLPFRYCEVEGRSDILRTICLQRESVHYPFDETVSAFSCSNDTLNQVWNLCKYSIKTTSFLGVYVDGDRERIPYEADALINQLCHYGVDREYSMARRSFEYLLERPTWPTEWILQAVLIAWQDYLYTGDSRSLRAHYDILKARTLLALKGKNGLISTKTGLQTKAFQSSIRIKGEIRDIVDWPHTGILGLNKQEGGEADGYVFTDYNTVVNAFHYEALKQMAIIADLLDKTDDVKFFEKETIRVKEVFNKTFLDKRKGYYVDGEATDHASLHANIFPLAFGLVSNKYKEKVLAFIHSRGMACSVYGAQFLMDALYEAGDAEYALKMLTKTDDRSWYNMIRLGSTISLEAWDDKYKPNQDWNHAWGAVPANIIPRKLMGVEPLSAGCDWVRILPQLGSLEWAKATIPTIRGEVKMDVENKPGQYILQVIIPANMKAEIYLPMPKSKYKLITNGVAMKASRVKGKPFLYLGQFKSGTYTIQLDR